ncbi:MAG: hypothetical protein SOH72_04390 [Bifidobacterium thermacidophilum]|uniref:hypothetical protein n=1 Tax=Bifidobacterium thermacidophilum TaxID=246618 RepID=UPI002F3524AC
MVGINGPRVRFPLRFPVVERASVVAGCAEAGWMELLFVAFVMFEVLGMVLTFTVFAVLDAAVEIAVFVSLIVASGIASFAVVLVSLTSVAVCRVSPACAMVALSSRFPQVAWHDGMRSAG